MNYEAEQKAKMILLKFKQEGFDHLFDLTTSQDEKTIFLSAEQTMNNSNVLIRIFIGNSNYTLAAEQKVILSWDFTNFVEHQEKNKMKLYALIEVEVPQYFGGLVVKLNAVIIDRISLVQDGGNN